MIATQTITPKEQELKNHTLNTLNIKYFKYYFKYYVNCNTLNNCNRPSTITNSQSNLIKPKRPTTVANRRPENQDISERKKVAPGRETYSESIRKTSNDIGIFGDNITNFSRTFFYQKKFPVKPWKIIKQD